MYIISLLRLLHRFSPCPMLSFSFGVGLRAWGFRSLHSVLGVSVSGDLGVAGRGSKFEAVSSWLASKQGTQKLQS